MSLMRKTEMRSNIPNFSPPSSSFSACSIHWPVHLTTPYHNSTRIHTYTYPWRYTYMRM